MKILERAEAILRQTKAKAFFSDEDEAICAAVDKELQQLAERIGALTQHQRRSESA